MTLSEEIASIAHTIVFSKIPPHTVERARLLFIDTFGVALALVRKKVNLDGFDEETIWDPRITAMAKRVRVMINPEMEDVSSNMVNLASKVTIHSKRGVFSKHLAICKGHPERPIVEEDVFRKFHECCQYNKTLSAKEIENTLSLLRELEDAKDVNEIFGQITWSV